MHEVVDNWTQHGFDVEMTDLWYSGDRHDVAQYLNGHGWETSETKMTDLFTANGFSAQASADDDAPDLNSFTYVTATRG
jgi:O-methyltransferase involved in polyketide biosynthesis